MNKIEIKIMIQRKNRRQKSQGNSPFPTQLAPASFSFVVGEPRQLFLRTKVAMLVTGTVDPLQLAGWYYVAYGGGNGIELAPVLNQCVGIEAVDGDDSVVGALLTFADELITLEGNAIAGLLMPMNQKLVQGAKFERIVASAAWDGVLGLAPETDLIFVESLVPDNIKLGPGWSVAEWSIDEVNQVLIVTPDQPVEVIAGGDFASGYLSTLAGSAPIADVEIDGGNLRFTFSNMISASAPIQFYLPPGQSKVLTPSGATVYSGMTGLCINGL